MLSPFLASSLIFLPSSLALLAPSLPFLSVSSAFLCSPALLLGSSVLGCPAGARAGSAGLAGPAEAAGRAGAGNCILQRQASPTRHPSSLLWQAACNQQEGLIPRQPKKAATISLLSLLPWVTKQKMQCKGLKQRAAIFGMPQQTGIRGGACCDCS